MRKNASASVTSVFQYSTEEGTVAGTMADDPGLAVPPEVSQRRHDELMALQQSIAFEQNDFLAGLERDGRYKLLQIHYARMLV